MISPLIDPALDAELAALDLGQDALPDTGFGTGTPDGREILDVDDYTLVTASHHTPGIGLSTSGTEAHVLLTGTPGPGSSARRGILRLLPTNHLREPRWDAETGTIDLSFHHTVLPMLLSQLDRPRRILWMVVFQSGRAYGDLHAAGRARSGPGEPPAA